jgi:hypothetical protein
VEEGQSRQYTEQTSLNQGTGGTYGITGLTLGAAQKHICKQMEPKIWNNILFTLNIEIRTCDLLF